MKSSQSFLQAEDDQRMSGFEVKCCLGAKIIQSGGGLSRNIRYRPIEHFHYGAPKWIVVHVRTQKTRCMNIVTRQKSCSSEGHGVSAHSGHVDHVLS